MRQPNGRGSHRQHLLRSRVELRLSDKDWLDYKRKRLGAGSLRVQRPLRCRILARAISVAHARGCEWLLEDR